MTQTIGALLRSLPVAGIAFAIVLVTSCAEPAPEPGSEAEAPGETASIPNYGDPLPSQLINGDAYPTAEATIDGWINVGGQPDVASIASHGWGLWAALTTPADTPVPGVSGARIYNTWLSPEQVRDLPPPGTPGLLAEGKGELILTAPRQFSHITAGSALQGTESQGSPLEHVIESVAYSPATAKHAHDNNLLKKSTLAALQKPGEIAEVPAFPTDSMAVKPVFVHIAASGLENGLYKMPAWPGTPDPAEAFPSNLWGACVYVDPANGGQGQGEVDSTCDTPTPQTTYNLSDFIYLQLTTQRTVEAGNHNGETLTLTVQPEDYMALVGMHVATREDTQWTWQTFWWTPDPSSPNTPSSAEIAAARPASLTGPPAHYAMATAYMMVIPAQPISGGQSVGQPMIAYNPHLEAPFDTDVFNVHRPITDGQQTFLGEYGVQSNCMTCHGMANFGGSQTELGYGTDFYIGRDDPAFVGSVQTDFLWSIPDDAN